jgi:predicted SAM-dependent methyltransferase
MRLAYKLSSAPNWYSFEEYAALLSDHLFVHHDLAYGIPLADNTADYIYSAHCIEHIHRDEAERLFRDAHRVLKPGGTMRLNVPSFEELVSAYQRGDTERVLTALFEKNTADEGWYATHRYMYDFPLLERLLREAGFARIVRCESGVGSVPDLETFEGRRSPQGLYVEAAKR